METFVDIPNRAMSNRMTPLLGSMSCLLVGSALLLGFMRFYTVPHVVTSMFKVMVILMKYCLIRYSDLVATVEPCYLNL